MLQVWIKRIKEIILFEAIRTIIMLMLAILEADLVEIKELIEIEIKDSIIKVDHS